MKSGSGYLTLFVCALASFVLIVGSYALYAPNPVSSRIGFGVTMSVAPAVISLLVLKVSRLNRSRGNVIAVFAVTFVIIQALWPILRRW